MNAAALAAAGCLLTLGILIITSYSSLEFHNWRDIYLAIVMIIAAAVGIVFEFKTFSFMAKWFGFMTNKAGKAMNYAFWGLLTWDYPHQGNNSDYYVVFSIVIVSGAGLQLVGIFCTGLKSKAIFDSDDDYNYNDPV